MQQRTICPSSYRVIELNPRADAPDGNNIASLNAEVASFLYQNLCVKSGETFDFEFYHNVGGGNRTDIAGIKAVAGGTDHTLIIQKNDTVKGYGKNDVGQITIPASLGKVTAISAGCDHSLAIKSTGTAMGWGGNRFSQAKVPTNLVDVKSISAGCNYSMAMMNDGTVFGWGRNENNLVTIPKGITNAFSIGASYVNSVISLRDGRVIVIGAPENDALITHTPTKTATPTP